MENIKRYVDENGFDCLEVRTAEGGHKSFTYYGAGISDIGYVSSSNGHGLGYSDYIRNIDDIQRHIDSVVETLWLNNEEKSACYSFLMAATNSTIKFLALRDRFEVKREYVPESKTRYTFTEKEPKTLHTKVSLIVEIPNSWSEDNAWRALFDTLKY